MIDNRQGSLVVLYLPVYTINMKKLNLNRRETAALVAIIVASILLLGTYIVVSAFAKCGRHGLVPISGTTNADGANYIVPIDASISPQKDVKKAVFDPLQSVQDLFQDVTCGCHKKC